MSGHSAPYDGEASEHVNRSRYREVVPPYLLRADVCCFWHHPVGSLGAVARVVPDGCIDMIWVDDMPPIVAGPATLPVIHTLEAGADIVGVRFRPGTGHRLLGIDAIHLLNQDVPLREIWPRHRCLAWEEPAYQQALPEKLRAIDVAIRSRLAVTGEDPFIASAATWIARHPSGRVDDLSQLSGLSPRQIHRRFERSIGYGPKKLQRIMRLQRLLWLADQSRQQRLNLARLALETGYADQPHMTREVTALTGIPPSLLLDGARTRAVSDLFKIPTP